MTDLISSVDFHLFRNSVIPMEELIIGQPNFISMLYYLSPSRFYVYHQQKCDEYLDVKQTSHWSTEQ